MLRTLFFLAGNLLALLAAFGLLARFVPPDVWWPPAILSLLLPVLLALNLLFVLVLGYTKQWRYLVLPVLVLLFSTSVLRRVIAFGGAEETDREKTLTVLSANVRGFSNDSWKPVPADQATRFLRDSPSVDILLLQEARNSRKKEPLFDRIKTDAGLAKRHQPEGKTVATYADDLGFVADVFPKRNVYNGYLITDVETALGTVRVINAHLQSNRISGMADAIGQDSTLAEGLDRAESMFRNYGASAAIRARQAEEIRKAVGDSPHPVIVGGDFNDVPSSYTYQRILTPRLRDAWVAAGSGLGTTFTGPLPGLRIDYLLVDTIFRVLDIERVETGFSDHLGLRLQLANEAIGRH